MKEIKYIHDIRNGDLVVTREGEKYIKIDNAMIGISGFLDAIDYKYNGTSIIDRDDRCYDIIEVWMPVDYIGMLSFSLDDRELVWKEQKQKYYIAHRWIDTEKYNYVNLIKSKNEMILDTIRKNKNFQTEFTAIEIEELKEKYNTTLEDFDIIPVKEI